MLATPDAAFAARVDAALDAPDGQVSRAPERVLMMDAARAVDTLTAEWEAPPEVVAVGPGLPDDVALRLAGALDERVPETVVVLVAEPSPEIFERALRAGVRDVVAPDADDAALRAAVEKAAEAAERRRSARPEPDGSGPAGRIIVVVSPKGGSGKTTVATNLAVDLAGREGDTVLVDLDVQFGDASSALQLLPEHTLTDAVAAREPDATSLKVLLSKHDASGLYVLAAPHDPVEGEQIPAERAATAIELLAKEFRYVVVDTSAGLAEHTLAALEVASDLVLICSMDVPSVQGFRKTITALDQIGMTSQARHVVLNRADARVGLETSDIERTVGVAIDVELPSSRSIPLSVNQGVPVVLQDPRAPVAAALRTLGDRFASAPAEREGGGLFGRRRRKR